MHTGNATYTSNVTAIVTVRFQVWQKFSIASPEIQELLQGCRGLASFSSAFKALKLTLLNSRTFRDEWQPGILIFETQQ